MNDVVYDWKRYWVPRDGAFRYDSDGFLLPPASDADRAFWPKTDVVGFDALITKPCLVLLGEPGIGKTFALREAEKQARAAHDRARAGFLFRNLGVYASDTHLVEDVFGSGEFQEWNSNGGELHMYLDSFDGCWHPELKTAMPTQLVERYLANNDCCHGLYLVGWFPPGQWDKGDSRRKRVAFRTSKKLEPCLSGWLTKITREHLTEAISRESKESLSGNRIGKIGTLPRRTSERPVEP